MKFNINTKNKGFTLAEFLIVAAIMGALSTFMTITSTRATASARATSIVRTLTNSKRALMEWYADNPEDLYYNNKINGTNHLRSTNPDGSYLTETFSEVINADGKKTARIFIKYEAPEEKKFDRNVSKGLASFAKSVGLYKTRENLSDENLISGTEIQTPFYMFVQEIKVN